MRVRVTQYSIPPFDFSTSSWLTWPHQDHFVQISELGRDGQVHDVIRKSDFGHRIRNAVVLGGSLEHGLDDDPIGIAVKQEPSPSPSSSSEDGISDDLHRCSC
jgi:hypothetical protein